MLPTRLGTRSFDDEQTERNVANAKCDEIGSFVKIWKRENYIQRMKNENYPPSLDPCLEES